MAIGNARQCPGNVPAMSDNEASGNTRQPTGNVRQDALIAGLYRGCPAMSGKPRQTPPYFRSLPDTRQLLPVFTGLPAMRPANTPRQ